MIESPPSLETRRISSFEEYSDYTFGMQEIYKERWLAEKDLASPQEEFYLRGYCFACSKVSRFYVDFLFSHDRAGDLVLPNWRETLICQSCYLKNRLRATAHLFVQECKAKKASKIYLTEQDTELSRYLGAKYDNITESEYLGGAIGHDPSGREIIRNEDLRDLSFLDNEFDYIISLEVLEHIPDFQKALEECFRCLRPGGVLLLTVPFAMTEKNITRARVAPDGRIEHLMEPEYHPAPRRPEGNLCYYHFGWELLDQLRQAGFRSSNALLYWSRDLCYLGVDLFHFVAEKW